ncbi:MAG: ribokinase [Tyzzerella sp.]|nr:ribokinase [Tyzzerella sp.]
MKLAVVGSINMDMTVCVERMPKKGETLLGESLRYAPGGKGANQAVAMAKLGAEVWMFGCVGTDSNGKAVLGNLAEQGVHTDYIQILEKEPTGLALITVGENDNMIIVVSGANAKVDVDYAQSICSKLDDFDMVILQHEIPLETVEYVVNYCAEKGIKVTLNPAPAAKVSEELIEKLTYITPNELETGLIFGKEKNINTLLQKYPEKLIITRGAQGAVVGLKNKEIFQIPANRVDVVDTTGAGDTFNGAFCVRIAKGDTMKDALRFANIAAGLSTEKFGAQAGMPTEEEVLSRI